MVDPARMLVEASTPNVQLGSQIGSASLVGVDGVKLQLVGAARALRDGVLPLTFRVQASDGAMLAVGQPVIVTAALKTQRKGIVLPAEAVVRSPPTRRWCGSSRVRSAMCPSPSKSSRWTRTPCW